MSGAINAEGWNKFCVQHGPDFSDTVFIPSLVAGPEELTAGVLSALAAATTRNGDDDRALPRIRAFRGAGLDYGITEKVTFGAFGGSDVHGWLRSLSDDPVCLAFNEIDSWNAGLADLLYRELTAPLAAHAGGLGAGVDWYSFIGESGWTPFGVHYDNESSMIFHLGPGPKRVWVWDGAVLPGLANGRRVSLDFADLLPSARAFVLEPGDFLSIPAFHLHVFENAGPSVFIGLTIFPVDAESRRMDFVHALERLGVDGGSAQRAEAFDGHAVEAELERVATRRRSRGYGKAARRNAAVTEASSVFGTTYRVTALPITRSPGRTGGSTLHVCGRDIQLPAGFNADALLELLGGGSAVTGAEVIGAVTAGGRPDQGVDVVHALERCGGLRPTGRQETVVAGSPGRSEDRLELTV